LVKPSFKFAYFIYGGYWKADYVYPKDAAENQIFGSSTNQSMVNSKMEVPVGDFIFLRPKQSEHVFLQFGKLLVFENNEIVREWLPLDNN
jgi:D-serine deaminase-like pyridoxal phosphate-dependent protein